MKYLSLFLCLIISLYSCKGSPPRPVEIPQNKDFQRAEQSFLNGDYPSAIKYYQRFIQAEPDSTYVAEALYRIGVCQLTLHQYDAALKTLHQARTKTIDKFLKAQIMAGLGNTYVYQDNQAKAAEYYQKAVQEDPWAVPQPDVFYNLGVTLMRSGQWEQGKRYLKKVLTITQSGRFATAAKTRLHLSKNTFIVQLGRFRNRDYAQRYLKELREHKGIKVYLLTKRIEGETIHFIWSGHFSTWEKARKKAEQIRDTGVEAIVLP